MRENPNSRARLQSSLGLGLALVLWLWAGGMFFTVVSAVAAVLCLMAWAAPRAHAPLQRCIDRTAGLLAKGVSWLLLGLVYFGVFTPLGLIARLCGRDPLQLRRRPGRTTCFHDLPPAPAGRFERQF